MFNSNRYSCQGYPYNFNKLSFFPVELCIGFSNILRNQQGDIIGFLMNKALKA